MIIYKITNSINDKIYIGKDSHNNSNYYGSGILINKAIKKYGKENFKKEIICYCFLDYEINDREKFYIKFYNSLHPNGYNLTIGGDGFSDPTGEIAKKISKTLTGTKQTKQTKEKRGKSVSIALKNKPWTELQKKVHNDGRRKGRIPWNKNKKLSKEHCKHISESRLGYIVKEETKEKLRKPKSEEFKEKLRKPWSKARREAENKKGNKNG